MNKVIGLIVVSMLIACGTDDVNWSNNAPGPAEFNGPWPKENVYGRLVHVNKQAPVGSVDVGDANFDDTGSNVDAEGPSDQDGDGIPDTEDACPFLPGVPTNDPATNGCSVSFDADIIVVDSGNVVEDSSVLEDAAVTDSDVVTDAGALSDVVAVEDTGTTIVDANVEDTSVIVTTPDASSFDGGNSCGVPNSAFKNHGACVSYCARLLLPDSKDLFKSCKSKCDCKFGKER